MPLPLAPKLGPYEIVSPLGAGGMGEVYRSRDPRLKREVAIKVLPQAFRLTRTGCAVLSKRPSPLAALNHPNILAVFDLGTVEGSPYVVSELLEGETLRERLSSGSIAVRKALDYALQIAHGLAAAHEKRDHSSRPSSRRIYSSRKMAGSRFWISGWPKLTQAEPGTTRHCRPRPTAPR